MLQHQKQRMEGGARQPEQNGPLRVPPRPVGLLRRHLDDPPQIRVHKSDGFGRRNDLGVGPGRLQEHLRLRELPSAADHQQGAQKLPGTRPQMRTARPRRREATEEARRHRYVPGYRRAGEAGSGHAGALPGPALHRG